MAKTQASHAVGYFHCYLSAFHQKTAPGPFSWNKSSDSTGRLVLLPETRTPANFASVLPIRPAKGT